MGLLESDLIFNSSLGLNSVLFASIFFALSFLVLYLSFQRAHFVFSLVIGLASGYVASLEFFLGAGIFALLLLGVFDFFTMHLPLWLLGVLYVFTTLAYNLDFELLVDALAICGGLALVGILTKIIYKKDALGEGDILVMLPLSVLLGAKGALLAIFLGSIAGLCFFVLKKGLKRAPSAELPFVSLLCLGSIFGVVLAGVGVV